MVELTSLEKRVIWHIKQHGGSRDEAAIVIGLLRKDNQQRDMLEYLMANPMATPAEIVRRATEIEKQKPTNK